MRHLAFPIRVNSNGSLATLEQDSDTEIAQSVRLLLATHPGERRSVPDYGLPDPVFTGVDVADIAHVIYEWEDRAPTALVDELLRGMTDVVDVYPAGTPLTGEIQSRSAAPSEPDPGYGIAPFGAGTYGGS